MIDRDNPALREQGRIVPLRRLFQISTNQILKYFVRQSGRRALESRLIRFETCAAAEPAPG
jgi:hypothetical protein